jgi:TetR/AcrR family transcriptional regulator, cholesterol catabolism regulator
MTSDVESIPGATPARQSQKEATRQRVIDAARELFDTHGYQGTTIREIARHAGVAVGSVFTTFASKGEILSEVMATRLESLYAEIARVSPHIHGSTVDRLRTMFSVHFEFEARQTRLFLAHVAAAYDWTTTPGAKPFGRNVYFQDVIKATLTRGVAQGDVRPDVDPQAIVDLLVATYAWTWRLVITEQADVKAMIAVMDRQIGLIAAGFAPKA